MFKEARQPAAYIRAGGRAVKIKIRFQHPVVNGFRLALLLVALSSFVPSLRSQISNSPQGAWYVRPDGGDRTQCTGKADAPYPGSGSGKPCGFKHPFFLFTDTTSTQPAKWVIASGDSVIIKNGSYRIGQDIAPGGNALWPWCGADQSTCGIPPPPSGTAAAHTRILGESWASCATAPKPELWGAAVYSVLTLTGSSFVDIQCLDITDHANCSRVSAAVKACNDATAPLDNYADNGINIAKASNVVLQDLDLHGLGYAGIKGNPNGATLTRLHVAGNSGAGIDFDPGDNSPSSGTIKMSYVTVEWNGCVEQYPTKGLYGACTDEDSGGYGDGVGTPDTSGVWSVDHSMFRYNTQDGLDLLHVRNAAVTVTDSAAYGNIGNQFKVGSGSPLIFQNNYAVSNCWTGFKIPHPGVTTSDYNKTLTTYCRAEGTPIVALISPGSQSKIQNNSIAGHTDILIYLACSDKTCLKTSSVNLDNNIFLGFNVVTPGNTNPPEVPLSVYLGDQDEFGTCCVPITNYMTNPGGTKKNNIYFKVRDREVTPEMVDRTDRYLDPLLLAESNIDSVNFHLTAASPAIGTGINIPAITHDYDGVPRPKASGYSVGAFEPRPRPSLKAVTNGANNLPGAVAPGEIVVFYGSMIGPQELQEFQVNEVGVVGSELAGTRVLFNAIPAPVIYTSAAQVAAIVPYAVTGPTVQVTLESLGEKSDPITVPLADSAPALFSLDRTGNGPAAALNQDGTINSPANPAKIGDIVSLFATGEGQTSPPGVDGKLAVAPLSHPVHFPQVTIGGKLAQVEYAGGAPGLVAGVMQINVRIPDGMSVGNMPISLIIGGVSSQQVITIAVGAGVAYLSKPDRLFSPGLVLT